MRSVLSESVLNRAVISQLVPFHPPTVISQSNCSILLQLKYHHTPQSLKRSDRSEETPDSLGRLRGTKNNMTHICQSCISDITSCKVFVQLFSGIVSSCACQHLHNMRNNNQLHPLPQDWRCLTLQIFLSFQVNRRIVLGFQRLYCYPRI